jgi:hypothetical protein
MYGRSGHFMTVPGRSMVVPRPFRTMIGPVVHGRLFYTVLAVRGNSKQNFKFILDDVTEKLGTKKLLIFYKFS